jgi:predicted dinucleotide-binding enzyme
MTTTLGLIGAGAVKTGYDVVLSNSRGPETLSGLVAELGPKARAATVVEAAKAGDLVVVTIPLKAIGTVPVAPLAGKIVIDTNNYYPGRDGHIRELDEERTTTSELLQAHLPRSRVVKAFNHIYAADLTTHGQPRNTPNRRALVIAGNDAEAKTVVTKMLDEFGFDTARRTTATECGDDQPLTVPGPITEIQLPHRAYPKGHSGGGDGSPASSLLLRRSDSLAYAASSPLFA